MARGNDIGSRMTFGGGDFLPPRRPKLGAFSTQQMMVQRGPAPAPSGPSIASGGITNQSLTNLTQNPLASGGSGAPPLPQANIAFSTQQKQVSFGPSPSASTVTPGGNFSTQQSQVAYGPGTPGAAPGSNTSTTTTTDPFSPAAQAAAQAAAAAAYGAQNPGGDSSAVPYSSGPSGITPLPSGGPVPAPVSSSSSMPLLLLLGAVVIYFATRGGSKTLNQNAPILAGLDDDEEDEDD